MGYYTCYHLEWDVPELLPAIEFYIKQHEGEFGVGPDGSPIFDEVKWYEHEQTMTALSKEFPQVTFILSGVGEEQVDMWRKRFKAGKMEWSRVPEKYSDWKSGPDPGRTWKGE